MKKTLIPLVLGLALLVTASTLITGCKTTQQVTTNPDGTTVTNVVKYVDPVRIQQAEAVIEPAASRVLRRAIKRSPEHAQEIGDYARAIGGIFCKMKADNNFSVEYVVDAADKATQRFQDIAKDEIIDAKNAAVALYKVFASDQLVWQLPDNQWLKSICDVFCNSIDTALKDSGQPGIK